MSRQAYVNGGGLLGVSWINIILFGFAFFFFTKLRDAVTGLFTWGDPDKKKTEQRAVERVVNVPVNQGALSRPLAYYATFANILYAALDGAGTDKSKIVQLLQHDNEEFKQIYKEFGVRENTIFFVTVGKMNLVEMLEYELNDLGDAALLDKLRKTFYLSGLW